MPIFDHDHLEYAIDTGVISIVGDDGKQIPAYWSHPRLGSRFPGIVLLHDWWGMNDLCRMLANFYAQMGYYVIVPDMFEGRSAATPQEALQLVEQYRPESYNIVNAALQVLETHHQTNRDVAAVGLGMGGSLAFEAAIRRGDLEAAVAFGGFPQSYLGQFYKANTPILAIYGSEEPYTKPVVVETLREELAQSPLKDRHRVEIFEGLGHEFFDHVRLTTEQREKSRAALNQSLAFMEQYLRGPEGTAASPRDVI